MHPYDAKHAYFPRDSARLHLLGEADVRPGGDVSSGNITNLDDVIGQSVQMAILTNNKITVRVHEILVRETSKTAC